VRLRRSVFPLLTSLLLIAGCSSHTQTQSNKPRVGLVVGEGGRGDKSFNDSAFDGLIRAEKELGIEYDYIEPGDGADREAALRQIASGRSIITFGIGFMFTDDMNAVVKDFPDKKFACIDYAVTPGKPIPDNLSALKFREQEGSFLVGAIAALMSKTGVIGFVGGMDIPIIHKFQAGYEAGAKAVRPGIKILFGYAGVTGEAFRNPAKGKALALSQLDQNADIIFHASGTTGFGVFEAVRERHKLAIGVDSDQYSEAPGYILTSMVKHVDVAVYRTIEDTLNNRFHSGVHELGLAENGVGYVYDEHNKNMIPASVINQVEALKDKIIRGEIQVPAQ